MSAQPESHAAPSRMRRALIILPEAPYPAVGGGPLRSASILESLARQFELTAVHFKLPGDPDPADSYPPGLLHESHTLHLPHHSKSFLPRLSRNLARAFQGIPPLIDRFSGQDLRPLLARQTYDLIWLEHFWLAPYAPVLRPHARKLVLDLHNIESAYYRSLAAASPLAHRPLLHHFANQAQRYEQTHLKHFDLLLTTSQRDATRVNHPNIHVLPNTIPFQEPPQEVKAPTLVFTGNFAYTPNQQALHWFVENVWPAVLTQRPTLRLRLVGKEIRYAHTAAPNIDYVGPVEDAVREIAKSQVAIVPLQSGSGTRLKILEAFAANTAVISTSLGAEGLDAIPSEHYKLADSPHAFAHAIVDLLENEAERTRLASSARRLYEANYTWHSAHEILSQLDL